ncbi:MAG: GSCFA domain-containing protein [Bacteroidota bacterium]
MDSSLFRTKFEISELAKKIEYPGNLLAIGSCFADNMALALDLYKFQVLSNPFGIMFNPISCVNTLEYILGSQSFSEEELIFHEERWISLNHPSPFAAVSKKQAAESIEAAIDKGKEFLLNADYLLLTWGTAWVYRWKTSQQVVANCYRLPANQFEKELLSVESIVSRYEKVLNLLFERFPKIQLICTLSPIRHWKDGATHNQVSKSVLRLALYELQQRFEMIYYFPAYELLMDDLRDYRFYAADMLHPSEIAVQYIWERFKASCIHSDCHSIIDQLQKISKGLQHKPRKAQSEGYQKHLKKLIKSIEVLESKEPCLNFETEKEMIGKLVHSP